MGAAPTFAMNRISRGLPGWTPPGFDYVIVGSGYGGSIAASKLARAGKTVCLLERGCEILPGSYPTDLASARDALQLVTARGGRLVPDKNAMMEVRVNDDVHVILGNGLGGGSLVNANVSIVPDMRVFNTGWPQFYATAKTGEKDTKGKPVWMSKLTPFFAEVKEKLGAKTMPRTLNKLQALYQSSVAMKQDFELAEINVTFDAGNNAFGFPQAACTLCGDCCSGCNYGAKNTLLMNYLPDAKAYGAVIVTEAEVDTIVKAGSGWTVSVYDRSKPFKDQKPIQIKAGTVILAAGSLGSTEILQRSTKAANGPSLSKALGTKFSANGDVLAFGFGANLPDSRLPPPPGLPQVPVPTELYSIGAGINAPDPSSPQFQPGPCITGIIRVDMDDDKPLKGGMVIEDGTAPGAFAALYPPLLFLQDVLTADPFAFPDAAARLLALQTLGGALQSGADPTPLSYTGIMTQMQSYLVMSHDDSSGKLVLDDTTDQAGGPPLASVSWAGAGSRAPYPRDNDRLAEAAGGIWADYISNPIWQSGFGRNIVSVHPLGGCPMADNDTDGVTDHLCRVYKGDGKNSVYLNLLVCDGSVVPTSLGVNPLLTISAITALAIDALVGKGVTGQKVFPPPPSQSPTKSDEESLKDRIIEAMVLVNLIAFAFDLKIDPTSQLKKLLQTMFSGYYAKAWDDFIAEFVQSAQSKDAYNGFTQIGADLSNLAPVAPDGNAPIQPFLQAFFSNIGDVTPSLCFSESMRGAVSPRRASQDHAISNPYEIAEGIGKAAGQTFGADFTIRSQGKVVRDSKTGDIIPNVLGADLGGTVTLTEPDGTVTTYTVLQGTFDLFPPDPDKVETWCMKYHCLLQVVGATAPAWQMQGTKYLQNRPGSFWWTDLSTLLVDLDPVAPTNAGPALQGIIRLDLQDIAAQVVSFKPDFNAIKLDQLKQNAIDAAKSGTFSDAVTKGTLLEDAFRVLLQYAKDSTDGLWPERFAKGLVEFYGAGVMGLFGKLILRTYGGYISYMEDFPAQADGTVEVFPPLEVEQNGWTCEQKFVPSGFGFEICLYHFVPSQGASVAKGPILLAPGMSTTARSFALLTNDEPSLVQRLLAENYDVWLFDSRLAPPFGERKTETGYTLDDIAAQDWPAAVKYVLANSPLTAGKPKPTLQILAHCVGALTAQMALLGGHVDPAVVRQLVLMQFTVHPAANWFNVVKSETGLAHDLAHGFPPVIVDLIKGQMDQPGNDAAWKLIEKILTNGTPSINPVTPTQKPPEDPAKAPTLTLDQIHNTIDWNAPFGIDHMCLSPTCHRIYGLYGPVIAHKNINEATHNALRQIFGDIATEPFEQLGLIMRCGRAVSSDGRDIYLPYYQRLDLPIHIISGTINQIVLPESGYYTQQWLIEKMRKSASKFTRTLIEGYAHNDCIIGKDANRDVFNGIMTVLDNYGRAKA